MLVTNVCCYLIEYNETIKCTEQVSEVVCNKQHNKSHKSKVTDF